MNQSNVMDKDNYINKQHIFNSIEEYMLSAANIVRYNKDYTKSKSILDFCNNTENNQVGNKSDKIKSKKEKFKESFFIPSQKDKLFWCFYILLNGFDEYEFIKNDSFKTEKNFKISSVEKMRSMKDKLKEFKIKRNEIENELVNNATITLKGLETLCLIYGISLIYISGKKYYEITFGDKLNGVIIKNENDEYAIKYEFNEEYITNIRNNYWMLESIIKPLKAISAYTIKQIQTIAEKLEISLINDLSKKKTKKQLYENILEKIE